MSRIPHGGIGVMTGLPTLGGDNGFATGVNDRGQIVGWAEDNTHDPTCDQRYYLLSHGSHLLDLARFLAGEIVSVNCRLVEKFGAYSWASTLNFANGAVGQLDLTIPIAMDWYEGFTIYGERGCVVARSYLPWHHRASDVECISVNSGRSVRRLARTRTSTGARSRGSRPP